MTPIGLGLRLLGRNPLGRRFDRGASTHCVERRPVADTTRCFRPL